MGTVPLLKCQCWGISVACKAHLRFGDSPSPYDQYWGLPWEPRFFEAPGPLLTALYRVSLVFIEIKFRFLRVAWLIPR